MSEADGTAGPTEVEWQFDAPDLDAVERWLAELGTRTNGDGAVPLTVLAKPARRLVDRYLDTEDWRIARAGFVLRTRQRGRGVEMTMKDTKPADPDGLRRRLEVTEPLPEGLGVLGADGPVGRRVHALAGTRPLVQVLQVRTRRRPYSLRAAGAEVAEVALDETSIVAGTDRPVARLSRVEVEVAPEWADALAGTVGDLREATALRPATASKYEAGLEAAGVAVPGAPDLGPAEAGPGSRVGELALGVVRVQVRELIAHEPGTRLGEDPEELHDMRVATRRLRAAFAVFADVFGARGEAAASELGWLGSELGAVRDLDVQLSGLGERAGGGELEALRPLLADARAEARRVLVDSLDSPRWERLVTELVAVARDPTGAIAGFPASAASALLPVVEHRRRRARSAAKRAKRSGEAADFHKLRVRGKRLRYAVEFTTPVYGKPAARYGAELARLQDALGRIQDVEVGATRLEALAASAPGLPPATLFAMGALAERYQRESEELRRAARPRLSVLDDKAWRKLRTTMRRAASQDAAGGGDPSDAAPGAGAGTAEVGDDDAGPVPQWHGHPAAARPGTGQLGPAAPVAP